MDIPRDLVDRFAKVTIQSPYVTDKKVAEYGTIKEMSGDKYVQLDGSGVLTPFITVSDVKYEERVKVEVIGHQAIVTGNVTNPSIGVKTVKETVDRIDGDITDLDIKTQNDLSTLRKEAEAERKRIEEELNKKVEEAKEDAAEADEHARLAAMVSTDYIEAVPGEGFYVGAAKNHEHAYNVFINAAGIQIRKGYDSNATVLSKWDASQLVIGQADKFHSTMKLNEFSIGQNNQTYMSLGLTGMTLNDAQGVPYAKYTTTGFTLGYTDSGTKVNLYGTNTALQFRKGTSVLTEFAMDRTQIGPDSQNNIVIDASGISIRNKTVTTSQFTDNSILFSSGKGSLNYKTDTVANFPWLTGSAKVPGITIESLDTNKDNSSISLLANKDVLIKTSYGGSVKNYILQRCSSAGFSTNFYADISTSDRGSHSWFSYWGYSTPSFNGVESGQPGYYTRLDARNIDWYLVANPRWVTFAGNYTDSYGPSGNYGTSFESFSIYNCGNFSCIVSDQARLTAGTTVRIGSKSSDWTGAPNTNKLYLTTSGSGNQIYSYTSDFYVWSTNITLWADNWIDCHGRLYLNGTELGTTAATAVVMSYENSLAQSANTVALYENQLRQDAAIISLYEQTL